MASSAYGIYNSQRALLMNQAALNIINNNIANMNTEGYSKQRLEISQQTYGCGDMYSLYAAAQSGGGAIIDDITRNRDSYLDSYFRNENTDFEYFKELTSQITMIEEMTNELSGNGVSEALDSFYTAANELSQNPSDSVARANFLQKAEGLCMTLNDTALELTDLRASLVGDGTSVEGSDADVICDNLNSQLARMAELNNSIAISGAQGMTPNGMLDERDMILDEISKYIPINVQNEHNNMVSVYINGNELVTGAEQKGFFNATVGDSSNPAVIQIKDDSNNVIVPDAKSIITSGKLGAVLDVGGSDSNKLTIHGLLSKYDKIAQELAREVNTIQRGGQYIDKTTGELANVTVPTPPPDPFDIFVSDSTNTQVADYSDITAANITLSSNVVDDPLKIAAANVGVDATDPSLPQYATAIGDGSNALAFAQLRDKGIGNLDGKTTEEYITGMAGEIGVKSESAQHNLETQEAIMNQLEIRRQSSMGVNLDEELADLVKFQRAYEATAKVFTIMDNIMEKVINLAR